MPWCESEIDLKLLELGEQLFREPLQHARAPRLWSGSLTREATRVRERIALTIGRAPEVVIRVTNRSSGAQGMGAVRHHLAYVSRDGALELEDQDGQKIAGGEALRDLAELWQFAGWGMAERAVHRENLNLLLSMPPGTDREAVSAAARAFAAREFGDGRLYVFAVHDDEPHPHVHLSVQVRGSDARRLSPCLGDLHRWRESFAQQLRVQGIAANATRRLARGGPRHYFAPAAAFMSERGEVPRLRRVESGEIERERRWAIHQPALTAWRELARVLAQSGRADDRRMAMDIVDFVRNMPVVREQGLAHRRGAQPAARQPLGNEAQIAPRSGGRPDSGIDR